MIFIFDSSSLINMFRHYYANHFPSLWEEFYAFTERGEIISVREVFQEIQGQDDALSEWAQDNRQFFQEPTEKELDTVAHIFRNRHFQNLVEKKKRLKGGPPVADPFVIAKAKVEGGWIVTEEKKKEGRADIPNVCEELNIPCTNLEGFMKEKKWKF